MAKSEIAPKRHPEHPASGVTPEFPKVLTDAKGATHTVYNVRQQVAAEFDGFHTK